MSDTNKQKSIAALRLVIEISDTALASIVSREKRGVVEDSPLATDQSILHKDLLSLLSLIQGSTTKLSLALKPSSPTYGASLRPLKDLSDQISALSHCVRLHNHNLGFTLIQEVKSVAGDIIQSVRVLCQTFLDIETNNIRTSTGRAGDDYMVRTGAVHNLIDKAKAPSGLSADNASAVRKKLVQDHASLEDALDEVREMTSDVQTSSHEDMDGAEEDGWESLGVESKKMSAAEIERGKKVHTILRLSTLLHKNIISNVLAVIIQSSASLIGDTTRRLDSLPPQSSALLAASDDLISAMYAPQNESQIATDLSSLLDIVYQVNSSLAVIYEDLSSLAEQMAQINLSAEPPKNLKKWFDTCVDQVEKAAESLRATLEIDT